MWGVTGHVTRKATIAIMQKILRANERSEQPDGTPVQLAGTDNNLAADIALNGAKSPKTTMKTRRKTETRTRTVASCSTARIRLLMAASPRAPQAKKWGQADSCQQDDILVKRSGFSGNARTGKKYGGKSASAAGKKLRPKRIRALQ